jgi:N,N'-diacetyllegionaminate synthase
MRIGARHIGSPVYIIAELGVNHDGSLERALDMTDAAAEAGADAIKLQLFRADLLMSRASRLAAYQAAAGEQDPAAMLRRLELSIGDIGKVVDRAHARGVHAMVTPFSVELVDVAERLGFDAYKTASPDIIHKPLLDRLLSTGRPLIVSTGAATIDEVARAAGWLAPARDRVAFLQCVSSYPTSDAEASIAGMRAISRVWSGPVGYSDHTVGVDTGAVAAVHGAAILEKHFTWSRAAQGPDHAASLESAEFRAYATLARDESAMKAWMGRVPTAADPRLGPEEKRVLACEQDVRRVSRQSIVARRNLAAGHVLKREDLTIKRPGTGIEPWRIDDVVGRRLRSSVDGDAPIEVAAIEGMEAAA